MILLGLFLTILLFLGAVAVGVPVADFLYTYFCWHTACNVLPAVFVLAGLLFHIVVFRGKTHFIAGLKAVWHLPKTGNAETAAYFRQLSVWTLGVGVVGMGIGTIWGICSLNHPETLSPHIAFSLLMFSYAGWITVLFFLPIAVRFSVEPSAPWRFPVTATLLILAAFILLRAVMAMSAIAVPDAPVQMNNYYLLARLTVFSISPADLNPLWAAYLSPFTYWDQGSLMLVIFSILIFRLAAGKNRNRFEWVPVSILYGLLWSITGCMTMFYDPNPNNFALGCLIVQLTTFYALIAAVVFVLDESGTLCQLIVCVYLAVCFLIALLFIVSLPFMLE